MYREQSLRNEQLKLRHPSGLFLRLGPMEVGGTESEEAVRDDHSKWNLLD